MITLKTVITLLLLSIPGSIITAQDWPNLGRYKTENENLGDPQPGERRIIFMGNSITDGWIKTDPGFFKGRPYIDRGIGGQTTPQMLIRFRPDVINLKPAVVVILAGTNDIAENTGPSTIETIAGNIFSMAELAQCHGIKVVLCSVLPVYDYPWKPGMNPIEKIWALNNLIRDFALKNGFIYADYYSAMVDERKGMNKLYQNDEVHPNAAGYKVMEPIVEEAIKKALEQFK